MDERRMDKDTEFEEDKLELYLNDIYTKECLFKIEESEVQFIRTGIENLVQAIVDSALERFNDPQSQNSLNEAMQMYRDDICSSDIIKVGSFYEGTKNHYPDEFDFIFLLYCSKNFIEFGENNLSIPNYSDKIENPLTNAILGLYKVTEKKKDYLHYLSSDGTRKIYFDKYMYAKGPAAKLRFIYESDSGQSKEIFVDLVPAVREHGETLERTVSFMCRLPEFRKEVLRTGSFLFINSVSANFTFTETEVRFMGNVLSKNHVAVYRILKHLINGHGDDETLKNHLHDKHLGMKTYKLYSSYRMKIMMVCHHYVCTNADQKSLGLCVLQILGDMNSYPEIDSFPKLVDKIDAFKSNRVDVHNPQEKQYFFEMVFDTEPVFLLQPYLQSMIERLKAMQCSEESYDYERDKIKNSLCRQFIEEQLM